MQTIQHAIPQVLTTIAGQVSQTTEAAGRDTKRQRNATPEFLPNGATSTAAGAQADERRQYPPSTEGQHADRMAVLWQLLRESFGSRWAVPMGASPSRTWVRALRWIPLDAFELAAETFAMGERTDPPSLPEFKGMCTPRVYHRQFADRELQAPVKQASRETAHYHLNRCVEALGGAAPYPEPERARVFRPWSVKAEVELVRKSGWECAHDD